MPTYDYRCRACGHVFEHFQGIHDKLLRTCPACGRRMLERLIGTGSGVVFKGSGFYETDYKRAPAPPKTDKAGGPAKGGGDAGAPAPGGRDAPAGNAPGAGPGKGKPDGGAPPATSSG